MNLTELLNVLGIERDVFDIAVANEGKDGEVDFDLSGVVIKSKDDYDSITNNYQTLQDSIEQIKIDSKKEGKIEGETSGLEIAVKKARKSLGLEFEGKTIENLLDAYGTKIKKDASIEPSQLIDSLTADKAEMSKRLEEINAIIESKDSEIENIHNDYRLKEENNTITRTLEDEFSLLAEKSHYNVNDIVKLSKLDGIKKVIKDGKIEFINPETGTALEDDIFNKITPKQYAERFMKDNKMFKPVEGGRNEEHNPDGKISLKSFAESQKARGYSVGSSEYTANLNKAIEDGSVEL